MSQLIADKVDLAKDLYLSDDSESDECQQEDAAMKLLNTKADDLSIDDGIEENGVKINGDGKPYHQKIQRGWNSGKTYTVEEISTILEYIDTTEGRKIPRNQIWWNRLMSDTRMLGRSEDSISRYVHSIKRKNKALNNCDIRMKRILARAKKPKSKAERFTHGKNKKKVNN